MAPFKAFSEIQHITSAPWAAASHYLQEERLSDKAPENRRSTGQFPWKIRFREASLGTEDHSAQQTTASRNTGVKTASTLETVEESAPSFLKLLQNRPHSGNGGMHETILNIKNLSHEIVYQQEAQHPLLYIPQQKDGPFLCCTQQVRHQLTRS